MEKVEVFKKEIQLPGKSKKISLVHYEWRFTDTEKNEIRRTLRNEASKEKIESFIHYLQGLCMLKKMLLEQPQRSEVRVTRERILTDCKAALGHLRQIHRGRVITWYDETLDPFWSHQPEQEKVCPDCKHPFTSLGQREKCVQCDPTPAKAPHKDEDDFLIQELNSAAEAILPLEKFIKVIEKYHKAEPKKIGRKSADSDHFIKKNRDVYVEHIGRRPTTYENNAFFS
jgi:hypothetical protein